MTDVSAALVGILASAIYPNGTAQPPVGGVPAKIYAGWPSPAELQADLKGKKAHVTVWATPKVRVTTRRAVAWEQLVAPVPTLAAAVAGTTVTLSGTVTLPQAVAMIVDGKDVAYGVQTGDTLASIAVALAALISASQSASAAGGVITIPGARKVVARIVANGTSAAEVARELRVFTVSVWADCFDNRDPLAKVITPALALLTRIALPDGTTASVEYAGSRQIDTEQRQGIYRREIDLSIEYATIATRSDTTVQIVQVHPAIAVNTTSTPLPIINT
ncbi:MAG: hypothetical protein ACRYGA_02345 [Janthinobacterium lividum]